MGVIGGGVGIGRLFFPGGQFPHLGAIGAPFSFFSSFFLGFGPGVGAGGVGGAGGVQSSDVVAILDHHQVHFLLCYQFSGGRNHSSPEQIRIIFNIFLSKCNYC